MNERIRLVVLDCDGTMIDSHAGIYAAVAAAWRAAGLAPPERDAARGVIGLPLAEAIARLAPELAPEAYPELTRLYQDSFAAQRAANEIEEPLYPGLLEALDAFEAAGALLGIATGKGRRGLRMTLEHHGLAHRFVTLQTSDVAPGKPRPDMVLNAMAETGAERADTVVIGDTSYDMLMAKSAGVAAIGVAWGYHGVDELRAAGADAIIEHFDQAPGTVERLVGERQCVG